MTDIVNDNSYIVLGGILPKGESRHGGVVFHKTYKSTVDSLIIAKKCETKTLAIIKTIPDLKIRIKVLREYKKLNGVGTVDFAEKYPQYFNNS
jgi:hypothetical protein